MDKILEWQATGEQLKEDISPDDEVLVYWLHVLDEFQQELPLLNKLSSEALKVCLCVLVCVYVCVCVCACIP